MGGDIQISSELIELCQRGDMRAFRSLVEQLKRPAYFHALALLGNHDDALDVSQEAFARAWISLASYDRTLPFYPWYYTILKRLSLNLIRSRKRRREVHDADAHLNGQAGSDSPEADRQARYRIAQVRQALKQLSVDDREIICLKDMQDYTYREIAAILDIPVGTVMSRLYGARARFRKLMQETGYEHTSP